MVDECLVITSSSGEEGLATIALAKRFGKDIMKMEGDQRFERLDKVGPLTEEG